MRFDNIKLEFIYFRLQNYIVQNKTNKKDQVQRNQQQYCKFKFKYVLGNHFSPIISRLVPLTIKMLDELPRKSGQIIYNNTALKHILIISRIKISADDKTLQKQQIILNDDTGILKCLYFYINGIPKFSGEETYCKVVLLVRFYQQAAYFNIIAFKECKGNDLMQHYANILSNEVNQNIAQDQLIDDNMVQEVLKLVKQKNNTSFCELQSKLDMNKHQLRQQILHQIKSRQAINKLLNSQQIFLDQDPDTYRRV
ncbi:hypothetical protein pb186bvf_014904 [Paramecium bursaria]